MKSAIYIEDGTVQLVITPETAFEKNAMKTFEDKQVDAQIFVGSFYDCRGGWVRQNGYYPQSVGRGWGDMHDRSLILRVRTEDADESPERLAHSEDLAALEDSIS